MSYRDESFEAYLDAVASEAVTPAGGTTAAIAAATGASLCEMVCLHAVANPGDADDPSVGDLTDTGETLRRARGRLLDLADADAAAVEAAMAASDGEHEGAMKRATGVPLAIAEACAAVVEAGVAAVRRGNRNARPDGVTGVLLARAALQASLYTVRTNADGIDDPAFVEEIRERAADLEAAATDALAGLESL